VPSLRSKEDRLRKAAGIRGEALALAHLQSQGLTLVERNYRCRAGEIDLVMLDGSTLVLAEVRYRASDEFGGAAGSVTWRKQRRLVNAAGYLLMKRAELKRYQARFDVVAITAPAAGESAERIEWIKRAFTL
jgi:putative endonuclease